MKRTIVLVGCSGKKAAEPCAAKDMYHGDLFKLSRRFVEKGNHEWRILSAEYGVVSPDQTIKPYDARLDKAEPRAIWSANVAVQLRLLAEELGATPVHFVLLAGQDYAQWYKLTESHFGHVTFPNSITPITVEMPFKGRGIGVIKQLLNSMIAGVEGND